MILFDDVVQVGTFSNLDGIVPTVIEFVIHAHAPQSGMGGLEAIQGNYSRLAVALESFTEEGLGGGDVTRSTQVGFDGFTLFIHSAVEVHPFICNTSTVSFFGVASSVLSNGDNTV